MLVAGSGAIGSYYGGRLAEAGHEVSLLCRSDYDEVKANGVEVQSYLGNFSYRPAQVIAKAEEFQGEVDYVFIATKHLPDIDYKSLIGAAVGKDTVIVLVQNGVEIEEPVIQAFPENRIIGGIAFIGVSRVSYGKIHHQIAGHIILGSIPHGVEEDCHRLINAFVEAGVDVRRTESIQKERWKKLIWNAGYNPTSVLAKGADTHQLMEHPESLALVRALMEEVVHTANLLGLGLKEDLVEKNVEITRKMNPYKTSMCLDYEAGRPMETEALLGNAVRAARKVGAQVPHMETLYALLTHYG